MKVPSFACDHCKKLKPINEKQRWLNFDLCAVCIAATVDPIPTTNTNTRECSFCYSDPLKSVNPAVCIETINGREMASCDECCDHDDGCRPLPERPRIVVLCGSTRFYEAFQKANYEETMAGRIVLSVGFYGHSSTQAHGQNVGCDDAQKIKLDELHKRKIDLADEVFVLNVGGYIGASTRSEILYANARNKPVRFLEPCPVCHNTGVYGFNACGTCNESEVKC